MGIYVCAGHQLMVTKDEAVIHNAHLLRAKNILVTSPFYLLFF